MSPGRRHLLALVACIGVAALWSSLLAENRNDDAYITYRHAQNLLAGRGFVFNPGEPVLSTTAPFHGLAVAGMGLVSPDLVADALVLSGIATAALGYLLYRVLDHVGAPVAGYVAAATVCFASITYEVAPLETVLVTALGWGMFRAQQRRRMALAGLLAGLAVGVRADAGLWVGLVACAGFLERREPRALVPLVGVAALVIVPWLAFAWSTYGDPLPATASAKTGWAGHAGYFVDRIWERGFARMLAGTVPAALGAALSLVGCVVIFRDPRYRSLRVVPVWIVAYVIAYSALRIFWAHHWYYFPWVVALAVTFAIGAVESTRWLAARLPAPSSARALRLGAAILFVAAMGANAVDILDYRARIPREFFVGGRDAMYRQVAQWLVEHTEPSDSVALSEPGTVAYYADRPVVDMMGLVTPEAGDQMKREGARGVRMPWVLAHFDPRAVVISWPVAKPVLPALPDAPEFVLQQGFSREHVDVGVLVYARPPREASAP